MLNRYWVVMMMFLTLMVTTGCRKKVAPISSAVDLKEERVERQPLPPLEEEALDPLRDARLDEEGLIVRKAPSEQMPSGLEDIYFDFDQWALRQDTVSVLENNVFWLHSNPNAKIQVEGYCDEKGTEEYNLALGERRARSTSEFLANLGISPARISVISYGEESGGCADDNDACHAKNRRVHFAVK